jgi:hypothetical protein
LTSYDDAVGWAEMIAEVVREQRMPPWHADPKHGKFVNDARLSDADKELLFGWVKNGAPEGDPKDLPEAPEFAEGWMIGEPQPTAALVCFRIGQLGPACRRYNGSRTPGTCEWHNGWRRR